MSKMDIQDALERIKTAPPTSPLLLLTCGEKTNVLCCFANTIIARQLAKQPNAIGVFDGTMDREEVKKRLNSKVREDEGKSLPDDWMLKYPKHSKTASFVLQTRKN